MKGAEEARSLSAVLVGESAVVPDPVTEGEGPGQGSERGYWRTAWYEFRHDRLAMIGLVFVAILVLAAVLAPLIAPYGADQQLANGLTAAGNPQPPGGQFLLGTDPLGRDELSRLMYGARVSLAVGLVRPSRGPARSRDRRRRGPIRRLVDKLLMRLADVILSFPILLLATAVLAVTRAERDHDQHHRRDRLRRLSGARRLLAGR